MFGNLPVARRAIHGADAANDSDVAPDAGPQTYQFSFTGSGAEYFRIWIVNLTLTILTLGAYSAWAKVRRIQYFHRNTALAGAVFDFDGDARAILRGRVLAVILLAAYHYAFGFSLLFGLVVIAGLLLAIPYLMRGALRFRLHNTRYRGLRFGFTGDTGPAYGAYLPVMLLLVLPATLAALQVKPGTMWLVLVPFYLLWPLLHARMKRYQHGHLAYGALASTFELSSGAFYRIYLKAVGMGVAAIAALVLFGVLLGMAASLFKLGDLKHATYLPIIAGLLSVYLIYLFTGPYLQVRLGNLVWNKTAFPGVQVVSTMSARAFMQLQVANTLLTLLTLGLFRPFAAVRTYRYRLDHITVSGDADLESMLAARAATSGSANADGVADFLGVDLSW